MTTRAAKVVRYLAGKAARPAINAARALKGTALYPTYVWNDGDEVHVVLLSSKGRRYVATIDVEPLLDVAPFRILKFPPPRDSRAHVALEKRGMVPSG